MKLWPMQCQEQEYSRPGGRWMDLPKAAPQGRAERERASSTAEPQYILILEGASTGLTPNTTSIK